MRTETVVHPSLAIEAVTDHQSQRDTKIPAADKLREYRGTEQRNLKPVGPPRSHVGGFSLGQTGRAAFTYEVGTTPTGNNNRSRQGTLRSNSSASWNTSYIRAVVVDMDRLVVDARDERITQIATQFAKAITTQDRSISLQGGLNPPKFGSLLRVAP